MRSFLMAMAAMAWASAAIAETAGGLEAYDFRAFSPAQARERGSVFAKCSRDFHNPESASWTRREVVGCMERAGYSYHPCRR